MNENIKVGKYSMSSVGLGLWKINNSSTANIVKGAIKKGVVPRVRGISSNIVYNYLISQKLPNSFNKTLNYFKKYQNCVLVFIKDSNLKSVTQTLKDYKNIKIYSKNFKKFLFKNLIFYLNNFY